MDTANAGASSFFVGVLLLMYMLAHQPSVCTISDLRASTSAFGEIWTSSEDTPERGSLTGSETLIALFAVLPSLKFIQLAEFELGLAAVYYRIVAREKDDCSMHDEYNIALARRNRNVKKLSCT